MCIVFSVSIVSWSVFLSVYGVGEFVNISISRYLERTHLGVLINIFLIDRR